jgi:hypothetical protein
MDISSKNKESNVQSTRREVDRETAPASPELATQRVLHADYPVHSRASGSVGFARDDDPNLLVFSLSDHQIGTDVQLPWVALRRNVC